MKPRSLIFLAFLLLASLAVLISRVSAAPYGPDGLAIEWVQPNGDTLPLRVFGDEFYARTETLDGYTVVFDAAANAYFYATLSPDGESLISSGLEVGRGNPGALGLAKHLDIPPSVAQERARERRIAWEQEMEIGARWEELKAWQRTVEEAAEQGLPPPPAPPSFTTTGNKVGLTLLIDFDDEPGTIPAAEVVDFCNGDTYTGFGNNGSVKQYYRDNSNNLLTYTNVVTAYIRIPSSLHSKRYYNDVNYHRGGELLTDAINILKSLPNYATDILPLFNDLTVDASNNVVACNVYFAGNNSGVWSWGLWPSSSSLATAVPLSPGGKNVRKFQITDMASSLSIGTFCHENGHMLCGFPDIYDYGYDSTGGAGYFCLMGYGNFNKNPAQISAYLKRAAGWTTETNLTSTSSLTGTLFSGLGTPGFNHVYRYAKPGTATEYFLFENRNKSGRDAGIPASGIAVWHVDELGNRDNQSLVPNTTHQNYELTLVQADNLWHFESDTNSGDVQDFYYEGNSAAAYTNVFNDNSSPNAHWWSGENSELSVSSFSNAGTSMTLQFGPASKLSISPTTTLAAAGKAGGPFTPGFQTYTLTNTDGAAALSWTATPDAAWVSVSPAAGTLAPGGSTTVTAAFNGVAGSLASGSYSGKVRFIDLNAGSVTVRGVALTVDDWFTELFSSGNDTDNQSWLFTPDGSPSFYSVTRTAGVSTFPTDPSGGTNLTMTDNGYVAVGLSGGARVSLFGSNYSSFYAGSNGYVTFGSSDSSWIESVAQHFARARIAALFDDLNPAAGGTVSWKQLGDRVAVTYQNVREFNTTNSNSFQIEMFFDGRIRITCLGIAATDGLIGLSRGSGTPANFVSSDFSAYPTTEPLPVLQLAAPSSVAENAGILSGQGSVSLPAVAAADLTVTLTSSHPGKVTVPATVVILAGQTSATFDISIIDDAILDGMQTAILAASAAGYTSRAAPIAIQDDDGSATITLTMPNSATEDMGSLQGTATLSVAAAAPVTINLFSSDTTALLVPPSVVIPAGLTTGSFPLWPVNDTRIDGTQSATVTASVTGWINATASVDVLDNETSNLALTLPSTVTEGGTGNGSVTISGTLTTPLVISLASDTTARLTVPATVTIAPGSTSAGFTLTAPNNPATDGCAAIQMTATATGFAGIESNTTVLDNDVHHLGWSGISSPQTRGASFSATLTACDVNGVKITGYSGSVTLSASGTSGSNSITPASATLANGEWTGTVTLGTFDTQVVLSASDGASLTGNSNPFDVTAGPIHHFVWNTQPGRMQNIPVSATITAKDVANNTVTSYSGTPSLSGYVNNSAGPTIIISEINPLSLDEIEFANASAASVNIGNWTIYIYDSVNGGSNPKVFTIPAGTTCAAGQFFRLQELGTSPGAFPLFYLGSDIAWNSNDDRIGVLICDANGNQVDFVCAARLLASDVTIPATIPSTQWTGATITASSNPNWDYGRNSSSDANSATGWTSAIPTIGTANTGMTTPFTASMSSVWVSPSTAGAFSGGVWTGSVTARQAAGQMRLRADAGSNVLGDSNPFDVENTLAISLTAAAEASAPLIYDGFTASGMFLNLALSFAPADGAILRLVDNTSFSPVLGFFAGLPNGEAVTATFGGQTYLFRIDYAGGDGNDVTLTAVSQAINFPAIAVKRTSDAPFTLAATATSGLPVSYQITSGAAYATLTGSTVTLTGAAGTVSITATQAGDGVNYGPATPVTRTFAVTSSLPFTQLSSSKGNGFVLGIRSDGTLWAWGYGGDGVLGTGNTGSVFTPVQIGSQTNWKSVSAGGRHTVAVKTDGTLWTWGYNNYGQLGQGTTDTASHATPVQAGSGTDWLMAVAGYQHTLALKIDGTLWAWGYNGNGELGQGASDTLTTHNSPIQVGSNSTWASIVAGHYHNLAQRADGTLWAWGDNVYGQAGNGTTTDVKSPTQAGTATTWSSFACGAYFTAATRTDGTLWTWGRNEWGQLGNGSLANRTSPAQTGSDNDWQNVQAGETHAMALKTDGSLWSWGKNSTGQLGQGFNELTARGNVPVQVGTDTTWQTMAPGYLCSVAAKSDGSLWSCGDNINYPLGYRDHLPQPVAAQFGPVAIVSGGNNHAAVLRPDGTLWLFGSNSSGQLGIGASDNSQHPAPVQPLPGTHWISVAAGGYHTAAVRSDGTLWAFGSNVYGQLGDSTTTQRNSPVQAGSDTNWQSVSAGTYFTVALRTDGTLWAWGYNANGQMGNGSTSTSQPTPTQVGSATDWAAVACGGSHILALKANGTLWAWGLNSNGQVGDSTSTSPRSSPLQVGSATSWRSISGGLSHSVATRSDGTLWAWGYNGYGQLGDGSTTQRTSPVQIGSGTTWRSAAAGIYHSYGTKLDGTLWSWGYNWYSQLGNGGSGQRTSPAQVGTCTGWSLAFPCMGYQTYLTTSDDTLWACGNSSRGATGFAWRNAFLLDLVLPALSPAQTVSFPALPNTPVGGIVTLAASSSSGLPVSYLVSGPGSLNGNRVTVTGNGPIAVFTWQAGDSFFQSSDLAVQVFNRLPPSVATLAATDVGTTTATLQGSINPNGLAATAEFQHGTSAAYGLTTPVVLSPSDGATSQTVSITLTGLLPGTTYHFRLSAANGAGSADGVDSVFSTLTEFQGWIAAAGITGSGSSAPDDYDGDGVPNLLEFALGADPTLPSRSLLPAVDDPVNPADGEHYLTLSYRRRITPGTLVYTLQSSNNLTSWNPIEGVYLEQIGSPAPTGDGVTEVVTFRIHPSIEDSPAGTFVRLRVTGN